MRTYKVVQVSDAESFESSLNELSQAGWKVVSANMAYDPDGKGVPTFFALLKNAPLDEELKQMVEQNSDEILDSDQLLDDIDLSPSAN